MARSPALNKKDAWEAEGLVVNGQAQVKMPNRILCQGVRERKTVPCAETRAGPVAVMLCDLG